MASSVNVQCLAGHVYETSDPKLVERSEKRAAAGYLDALILHTEECEECKEERQRDAWLYSEYDMTLE